MIRYCFLPLLFLLLSTPSLCAVESGSPGKVSLSIDQAVTTGLLKNRTLEIARLEREMAGQKVRESWADLLPQLNSGFEYTRHVKPAVIYFPDLTGSNPGNLTALEISADNAMTASLSLSQKLFDYRAIAGIRASSIVREISAEAYREARSNVIGDIKTAYYNVLIADEQVTILEQSIKRWEKALQDSRALFSQGVAADIDTLRAFLSVENIRPDLIQARSRAAVARTEFKNIVGLDPLESVRLTDSLVYRPGDEPDDFSLAYEEAVASRPDVRQLELRVEAEGENVSAARAEGYPSFTAVGQLQTQTQFDDGTRLGDTDWPVSSSVGVQVSMPLFTGFGVSSRVEQAKIGRMQTVTRLDELKADIRAEIQTRLFRLLESRSRIEVQQRTTRTAERSYEITLLRFREGIGSQLELADAELQLNKARTNYLQAVYDYLVARIEYEKALGRTDAKYASEARASS
ncbi:transporter [Prosthecochloris sp. GSB1]|uniref:TolC family protein n=1 Tax=Prosthecochloris sp. GSB1 TaxID=281093 RepID=UPI000B8CB95D|nr:TolC family protein [Prosthecochloris sp. GSB1]ASQ90727.1 transporter [Prosthecochloris sp. GSB1]